MILKQLSYRKIWNFDTILCSIFLLVNPYFILDVISRTFTGNNRFQFDWIFILIGCVRLLTLFLYGKSIEKRSFSCSLKIFIPLFLVILYTLFITSFQLDFLLEKNIYFPEINEDFIINRGLKYIIYTAFSLYFATVINTWPRFYTVLLFFISGLCVAEVLGLLQEIVFLTTQVDVLPITRTLETGLFYQSATVDFAGLKFLRINSIAQEPKGLAELMSILFIFKFYASSLFDRPKQFLKIPSFFVNYLEKTWILTFLVMILTFSGSGLLSFGFVFLVSFFYSLSAFLKTGKFSKSFIISAFLVIVVFFIFTYFPDKFGSFIDVSIMRRASGFFEERTLESLYSGSTDPEDATAIINVIKFPELTITGIGFGGYSNLSLPIITSFYTGLSLENSSAFSRNIFIEVLFSSGIIGIIGCLFFARRLFYSFKLYPDVIMVLGLVIVSSFLVRSNEIIFFIFVGLSSTTNYIMLNDISNLALRRIQA